VAITIDTIRANLKCPECSFPMTLMENRDARYPKTGTPRLYYRCGAYPRCNITHGAHPDGSPLGFPGDRQTREARYAFHEVFDQVWKSGPWSRSEAYRILQLLMDMPEEEAHVGNFSGDQCYVATQRVQEFKELNSELMAERKLFIPEHLRRIRFNKECEIHGVTLHWGFVYSVTSRCMACLKKRE
jgi:hypothetical protein